MAITDATNPQAITPTPAEGNDTPVTPNTTPIVNDLDLSLDLPPVVKEENTSDTDRLKEEDKLVEAEVPTTEVIKLETPAEVKEEAIVQENLPLDAKEFTLQDDMKIIQELKNPEATKIESPTTILETKPIEATEEVQPVQPVEPVKENKPIEPVAVQPVAVQPVASNTMNLDSLLFETPATVTTAPVESIKNPFDLIQANTPAQQVAQPAVTTTAVTTAQAMPAKKKNGVKIGLFIVMFVALGFLTYFIISTMYPMGLFNNNTAGQNNVVAIDTGASLTGDILTGTEVVADTTGSASGDIAMTSGTSALDSGHGSAMDPNFSDINALMNDASGNTTTPALNQDTVVAKLNNYGDLGAKYLVPSKSQNDLQSMKYSLFLKNKSQTLLNEIIANPTTITTMQSDLTTQLAQMETFLQALQTKYGDLSTATAQTQTGTPDQIPNALTQE